MSSEKISPSIKRICTDCGIAKIISEGKWPELDVIMNYVATETDKANHFFDPNNPPQYTTYIYRIDLPPIIDYQGIPAITGMDLLDGFNNLFKIRPRLNLDNGIAVGLNSIAERDKLQLVLTVIDFIGRILAKYYETKIANGCNGRVDTVTEI